MSEPLKWQMPEGREYRFETDDGFEGWTLTPECGVFDVVAVVTHAAGAVWATRFRSDEYVPGDTRGEDWCAEVVARERARLSVPSTA